MKELNKRISIKDQKTIFKEALKKEIHLSEILQIKGLTYDNLRYNNYVNGFTRDDKLSPIEEIRIEDKSIPAISFFSGAGGMDLGFEYAGYETIACVENTELFCDTLSLNNPKRPVIGPPYSHGDISIKEEIAEQLEKIIGKKKPFKGVFHGGPPCQPFSIASNQRFRKGDLNFKRKGFDDKNKGNLLFDYVWLIEHFRPTAFVIENVPGLKDIDNGAQLSEAIEILRKVGYNINEPTVLNASYHGVPQNRTRLFVVGTLKKRKKFQYPEKTIYQSPCIDTFEMALDGLDNHETRKHTVSSITRYVELDFGQRDQRGRVDRLNPFLPSKTVIAGGTKGGGRSHLHPYIPRTLSVRESARLQTFPDDYIFTGSTARQFTQVGNAVPPKLAYVIAKELRKVL